MKDIIFFHESEIKCSAELTDWVGLNKINNKADDFLKYLGNYMSDEDTTVYALFGDDTPKRYCVIIDR